MSDTLLFAVEKKLDELIALCSSLEKENASLKSESRLWLEERERLVEKNELARKRVEDMIKHLKSLESES